MRPPALPSPAARPAAMDANAYIPEPLPLSEQRGQSFSTLVALMQRLLSPDGCPWDREQTPESLRRYVLEEACEVIDAIEGGNGADLAEELGDLALQIAFLSELSRPRHGFGPDDVIRGICEKLVRRHPHVFERGAAELDPDAVARQWEAIKAEEKAAKRGRRGPTADGLLASVPRALPPLTRARELSDRAARVGFDWPDPSGSRAKVDEELTELDEALGCPDRDHAEAELGDVLFALVNLARHHRLDAARALAGACDRFARRFHHVEDAVRARHGDWPRGADGKPTRGIALGELDRLWEAAKAATHGAGASGSRGPGPGAEQDR